MIDWASFHPCALRLLSLAVGAACGCALRANGGVVCSTGQVSLWLRTSPDYHEGAVSHRSSPEALAVRPMLARHVGKLRSSLCFGGDQASSTNYGPLAPRE